MTIKNNLREGVLIYPHQLFEENILLSKDKLVFLVEDPLFFTQYTFHKQKIVLHRASMKAYKAKLRSLGYVVHYIESSAIAKTKNISSILRTHNVSKVSFFDPVDNWLEKRLARSLLENNISYEVLETPMFLSSRDDIATFFSTQKGARKYFMKNFYTWQRKRLGILLNPDGTPVGGTWSFDTENRKKLPKNIELPPLPLASSTQYVQDAVEYIEMNFKKNYGSLETFFYPTTHEEAHIWLTNFLKEKFVLFGPYEDAITTQNNILFHSVLSPLLNIGLLTPKEVVDQTLKHSQQNDIPLPSLEGFLRQIIGWREYMRAIYMIEGTTIRNGNYFKANRTIPKAFWTAKTGIPPLDTTIEGALKYAYSHHIERLMVMGNFMNLCGFNPDQVYEWFMEMYIDAYDWVMVPNVYSMALYADGGIITTKPYVSSSNYILKMSDHKKDAWCETWDALFWNFVGIHFEALEKEGRLGFIGVQYRKMSAEKKESHQLKAKVFLSGL